jgi:hypothetical protein
MLDSNPVRVLLSPIVLLAAAAAAQAFIDGADTRGIITAALAVLILGAQELARKKVTPVADPHDSDGVPLVPDTAAAPVV